MIKAVLHKSFSVLLALVVLFSTISFTVDKHFCGTILVDASLFSEAKKCGMEAFEMPQETMTKKSCCKDELHVFEGQDELKYPSFEDLDFQQKLFITAYSYAFINLFEGVQTQIIPHKNYSPPNLVTDIQVLDQVFII